MSQQYTSGGSNESKGWGSSAPASPKQWEYFDALPRPLREAIAGSKFKKNIASVYGEWKKGVPMRGIIAAIKAYDEKKCAEDARKVWGREPVVQVAQVVTMKDLGL